jgi:hypothetical protein
MFKVPTDAVELTGLPMGTELLNEGHATAMIEHEPDYVFLLHRPANLS